MFGEFIAGAYDAWGKRKASGMVRLALQAHLIEFRGQHRFMISPGVTQRPQRIPQFLRDHASCLGLTMRARQQLAKLRMTHRHIGADPAQAAAQCALSARLRLIWGADLF